MTTIEHMTTARADRFAEVQVDSIPAAAALLQCSPWDLLSALVRAAMD